MISRILLVASGWVAGLGCVCLPAQERFDLQVPGTDVRSRAELTASSLTITDARRRNSIYTRRRDLDSPDGAYVGFLNSQLRQAIRWPVAGRGAFQIGSVSPGGEVSFRESRMRITRLGPPPVTTLRPMNQRPGRQPNTLPAGPTHVATTVLPGGGSVAAYVDAAGALQFAVEDRGQWRLVPGRLQQRLVPGAALSLWPDSHSPLPQVFTAGADGRLTSVTGGSDLANIVDARLVPGGQLLVEDIRNRPTMFAVNAEGHLLTNQLDSRIRHDFIDATGKLPPGGHVALLGQDRIVTIDRGGVVRGYRSTVGRWLPDDPMSLVGRNLSGFVPGASLTALRVRELGGGISHHLITVDALGRLQVLNEYAATGRWQTVQVPQVVLPPGAAVAAGYARNRIRLSATLADGGWYEWHAARAEGPWTRTLISRGFARFAPVHLSRRGRPHGFALDRRGILVAASLDSASVWHPVLLAPGFDVAPVLTSRRFVPNPPLPRANVAITNEHSRELWLLVTDLRSPGQPRRLRLKPRQTASVDFERDAGGKLVETVETLGRVEERVYEVPPQQLYDVSVYELMLQSVAIDRTKSGNGKVEDINWSPKSIGIFPLPPGDLLRDNTTIDAFAEAKSARNPGGVRRLDMSRWKIDNTVPEGLRVP